ncbi:hypothetical protein ACRRTK_004616 [Alexandromys fortis]
MQGSSAANSKLKTRFPCSISTKLSQPCCLLHSANLQTSTFPTHTVTSSSLSANDSTPTGRESSSHPMLGVSVGESLSGRGELSVHEDLVPTPRTTRGRNEKEESEGGLKQTGHLKVPRGIMTESENSADSLRDDDGEGKGKLIPTSGSPGNHADDRLGPVSRCESDAQATGIPSPGGTNCDKQVLTALGTSLAGWPLIGSPEA